MGRRWPARGPLRRLRHTGPAGVIVVLFVLSGFGAVGPLPVSRASGVFDGVPQVHDGSRPPGPLGPAPRAYWLNASVVDRGPSPAERQYPAMAFDPAINSTVLFGGSTLANNRCCTEVFYDDTWEFAHGTWSELNLTLSPSARSGAHLAWDASDGYLLLFGGTGSTGALDDTWGFAGDQWFELFPSVVPPPLVLQSMASDPGDGYVVLYGGGNYTTQPGPAGPYNYTYTFAGGNWTNRTDSVTGAPPALANACLTYDTSGSELVLFGGTDGSAAQYRTWTFADNTWQSVTTVGRPDTPEGCGMADDPDLAGAVEFGGSTGVAPADAASTWLFGNGNWTNVTAELYGAPAGSDAMGFVDQSSEGYLLLFGGFNASLDSENSTWTLGPSVLVQLTVSPPAVDSGETVYINASAWSYAGSVTYSFSGLPPSCLATTSGDLSCAPTTPGIYEVNVTVNGSLGFRQTERQFLDVNPPFAAVHLTLTPGEVTVGFPTTVFFRVDNGTPPYSYSYSGLPPGCVASANVSFLCTPTQVGGFTIRGSSEDARGERVASTALLVVNPRPSFLSFGASPSLVDVGQSFTIATNVTAGTPPYTYRYNGLPSNCTAVDAPQIVCWPTAAGIYPIRVNVTDSSTLNITDSATVTVNQALAAAALSTDPAVTDAGFPVVLTATTQGGTPPFTYEYTGLPPGCASTDSPSLGCTPRQVGNWTVSVRTTDALGESVLAAGHVTAEGTPSIYSEGFTPSVVDAGQNLTVTARVAAGTPPFTFTFVGLPDGCPSGPGATITCRPLAGTYEVTANLLDAVGARAALRATLVVNVFPAVELTATPGTSVNTGTALAVTIATIGGAGPFEFQLTGLPPGCPVTVSGNVTCTPTQPGDYLLNASVVDAAGARASAVLPVEVTAPLSPLVIGGLGGGGVAVVIAGVGYLFWRRRHQTRRGSVPPSAEAG